MTSSGGLLDPSLQTAFPTPSRIPVLARKCLLLSEGGSHASGRENRDPKGMVQRKIFRAQFLQKDHVSSKHKLKQQAVGSKGKKTRPRAPLEEISLGSAAQNARAEPPPGPGTALRSKKTAFVAADDCSDGKEAAAARSPGRGGAKARSPGDLTATLPSMEVTSGAPRCRTGLAQRVLIRGNQNQKDAYCGAQVQTPAHHTRSSLFSSNQKSTERSVISQAQKSSDSGQPWARTRLPAHQPPRELTVPAYSAVLNSSQSRRETHSLAQQVLLKGTHEAPLPMDSPDFPWTSHGRFTPGQVGHASPFGLANRVPVSRPPALTSYSVVRHLAVFSKTSQATPAPASSLQEEQIVVKQLYEESWTGLEEKPEKPSPITPLNRKSLELNKHQADPRDIGVVTPSNRISLELSKHKVDPRDGKVSAPSNWMSLELSRHEDSKDVGVGTSSNKMSLELSTHERINILKQLLQQEVEGLTKVEDSHQSGKSHLKLIEPKLAMIPCISEPSDHCSALPNPQGPKQHPDVGEPISTGSPGIQELTQQPNFGVCTTASTNLTFFQCPLCGSIPLHSLDSLRSPMGTIGPAVLALCQQLNTWLEAIRLLYEGCLDDECAFYTGRGIPGPQRICKNPVATWLERQEAMDFVPISSPDP
ncbi:tastin isoform X1 [Sarcophilus harrisii]|uniref:Trophinin associated protein n=1 Tax=Sarcophilus harrisii TaxID=9305 RepID=G3VTF5_SARHA|nr:tastin isoform X1 [Sarcophilus harrisii]